MKKRQVEEILSKYSKTFTDLKDFDEGGYCDIVFKINYKGKHYVLCDIPDDEFEECVGFLSKREIGDGELLSHISSCIYYGIPPYIGNDKEFNARIDKLIKDNYYEEAIE